MEKIVSTQELSSQMKAWLSSGGAFPETLEVELGADAGEEKVTYEILDRESNGRVSDVANRVGYKGYVLKVRDRRTRRIRAAKICLAADYDAQKLTDEVDLASRISTDAPIVVYDSVGWIKPFPQEPSPSGRWLCFIGPWIEGRTLEQILRREPDLVGPQLALRVLKKLLEAVLYLERIGIKHDDLHLGNIMLYKVDPALKESNPEHGDLNIKVVDIGSLKRREQPTDKAHDDWSSYTECIVKLHNHLHRSRSTASKYYRALKHLKRLAQTLSDEDHGRHFPHTNDYYAPLESADRSLHSGDATEDGTSIASPFEAISAEHLASDQMLQKLFIRSLPWFDAARDRAPLVLKGPRGCGKSMVFRYMALKAHLGSDETTRRAFENFQFFGVYIGCATDLQNDLLWIQREPGRVRELTEEIVTFFCLVLAREFFRSISHCMKSTQARATLGLSERSVGTLCNKAIELMELRHNLSIVQSIDPALVLADELDRCRIRHARSMLERQQSRYLVPQTFIRDLSRSATELIPGLSQHPIVFLLDDYTKARLGEDVQAVLNSVVWLRDPAVSFKISCEPFGFEGTHIDGAQIDQNREFISVDTGAFLQTGSTDDVKIRRDFIESLLDKRLEASSYKGRIAQLLGESEHHPDPKLALNIRTYRSGRQSHYFGIDTLANAWSGDVSTVLFMVREMFQRAGIVRESVTKIPPHIQHDSIVHVSKALVQRISYLYPYGAQMRTILDSLAGLARKLLTEGALQRRDKYPQRRYRIELTLREEGDVYQNLSAFGKSHVVSILKELVRRAVLIDLGESRAKEGAHVRTARFQLRSSLLPNYATSLVRKNYIPVRDIGEFCLLFEDPSAFSERMWGRLGFDESTLGGLFAHTVEEVDDDGA